jgi:hypothetical protein
MLEGVGARSEAKKATGEFAAITSAALGPLGLAAGKVGPFGPLGAIAAASGLDGLHSLGAIGAGLKFDALAFGSGGSALSKPKFGITDPVVADWRRQLAGASTSVQASVAGAMGQAIAADHVRSFGGFDTLQLVRTTLERTAAALGQDHRLRTQSILEQFRTNFEPVTREIVEGVRPVAILAAEGFSAEWANASKREREYREALWRMGWWFPSSMPFSAFWRIGKMAAEGDRFGVQRAMNEISHSDGFLRHAKREWFELPVFRERARFLLDGFDDHRRGRHRVSIPVLLPHLEGIAVAAFAPRSTVQNPRLPIEAAVIDTDGYRPMPFSRAPEES